MHTDPAHMIVPTACHLGLARGRGTRLCDTLEPHPLYLSRYSDLYEAVLQHEGALSPCERSYLGVMAAARHKSQVFVEEQSEQFLGGGGDPRWLDGLASAPPRLRKLADVNAVLCHRPWELSAAHVETLVEAGFSLGQVVHALALLAFFHASASLVHAVGIEAASGFHASDDYASQGPPDPTEASFESASPGSRELATGGVRVLLQRLQDLPKEGPGVEEGEDARVNIGLTGPEEPDPPAPPAAPPLSQDSVYPHFARFAPNLDYSYTNFYGVRGDPRDNQTFPTLKYNQLWERVGFSMLGHFTSHELADAIDRKFKETYNLTYNTCGDAQNVNTDAFRRAIWNYTQSLYGIRWDDYEYSNVNKVLDIHLKMFLKTMSVAPERLTGGSENLSSILQELEESEKVHVAILCAEARFQAAIVYAMLAVEKYYMS